MKSRTVLNIALFIAIVVAVLSLMGFILSFVVKGEQVYVPIGKSYYKTMEGNGEEEKKESFYFGKNPNNMSAANIFDSSSRLISLTDPQISGSLDENQAVPEMSKEDIFFYLENPDKCTALSGYELTGTIVAKDNDFSFAILKGGKNTGGAVTRTGAEVQDGVVLAFVWRNLAIFRTTSGVKCVGEGVAGSKPVQTAEAPKVAEDTPPKPRGTDDIDIRNVGPNQYVLKRSDVSKLTGNLGALASQARVVPSRRDNGFKIFAIAKDSVFNKLGVQNGDVIKSVNGIELSSPDKALEAYSRLRNASKLSLDLLRKGQSETLEYTIE